MRGLLPRSARGVVVQNEGREECRDGLLKAPRSEAEGGSGGASEVLTDRGVAPGR